MATAQAPPRHETFVEAELARARRRIRSQDVGTAALGLAAGTLAYALGMVLLDRWLVLPALVRQLALVAYLLAAGAYVAFVVLRPFRREVNPYFAARQVERAVPGSKNSVVSWLDLRDEPLPPSIRNAVGLKAATDLKRADLDEVIRDRRLPVLGGTAGGLFLAALILFFLLRPAQFLSLLGRAFAPFHSAAIAAQTTLTLLQPAGGDVTVPIHSSVEFRVAVAGRVPDPGAADAIRLRVRYNPADPVAEEMRFAPNVRDPREFALRLSANQVQSGFVYQIVGGDAATPEYQVRVRSSPLIEGFDVLYHYRPYLRFSDQTTTQPNLEAIRGTEVTLTARTNRTLAHGKLTLRDPAGQPMADRQPISGEVPRGESNALRFQFVMEQDGKYVIRFQSAEGEQNQEPQQYTIRVLSDYVPQVEITRPAPETLPINGLLQVEGKASDDFGITKMRLCLQVKDAADAEKATRLADRLYRPEKDFKFADGTYPRSLDYLDAQSVEQLKTPLGLAVEAKPGLVIEYWLEAEDNCDYPDPKKPNVGRSKTYHTTLAAPQDEQSKKDQSQAATKDQQKHNQQQDQEHAKENEGKKEQQPQQGNNPNPQQPPQQGDQNGNGQDKPGDKAGDRDLEQQAKDTLDKLNQRERDKDKGAGKNEGQTAPPDPTKPGEPKGEPKGDNSPQNANPQQQPGEPKGDPKNPQQPSGQQQPSGDPSKGDGKGEGKPQETPQPGEPKPQPSDQNNQQGANQNPANPNQPNNTGGNRQNSGGSQNPNEQPKNQAGEQNPGEPKPQPQNQPGQQNPGESKPPPQQGDQPGAEKPSENAQANGNKQGNDAQGQRGGDPNSGNPPQAGNQPPRPGDSNNPPPNQRGSDRGDPKSGDTHPPPSGKPPTNDAAQKSQQTPPGRGSTSGDNRGAGSKAAQGPQKDPNNKNPDHAPDSNDRGRQGPQGKTGSGQAGDKPPPDGTKPDQSQNNANQGGQPAPQPGASKGPGQPEPPPDKADAKPASGDNDPNEPGQGGAGSAKGDPPPKGELKDAPKPGQSGNTTQADPKTAGTASDSKPQGDAKPDKAPAGNDQGGGQQGDGKAEVKPEQKPSDGPARKPTADEIAKLAEQLRKADPNAVRDAMRKLEELKNQSGDPQTRQAIDDAMKQMGDGGQKADAGGRRGGNDQPKSERGQGTGRGDKTAAKAPQPDQRGTGEQRGQAPQRGDQSAKAPPSRGGDSGRGEHGAKGQPPQSGQQGNDNPNSPPKPGAEDKPGQPGSAPGQPSAASQKAGNAGTGAPTANQHGTDAEGSQPPAPLHPLPDPKNAAKSGDLQLEKFPKTPDPDLLKDLNMTPDEYRQFLQRMADYEKRRQTAQTADAANNLQRGSGRGSSAANSPARRVEGGTDKPGDLNRGGAAQAPPEYQRGYKGFTEDVSKTAGPPKKDAGPPKQD